MCHVRINQYDAAIGAFERTVRLKTDYIHAYKMLAKCYKAKKDSENVIKALNGAFQYEENLEKKFEYKMEVIRLLVKTENYVDAKIQINTVRKFMMNPSLELLYNEALISNRMGDYKTAKSDMTEAVRLLKTPALKEIAKYYYELGYAHYKLKEYDQASEAWSRAVYGKYKNEIMKYEPKYYYQTAEAYFRIYEYSTAKEYLERTLKVRADYAPAKVLLGKIAERELKRDKTIQYFKEAIPLEEHLKARHQIYRDMAVAMLNSGYYKEATDAVGSALKIRRHDYEMEMVRIIAFYRLRNYAKAVYYVDEILQQSDLGDKILVPFFFAGGMIYRDSGSPQKAKLCFKRAAKGTFRNPALMEYERILKDEED